MELVIYLRLRFTHSQNRRRKYITSSICENGFQLFPDEPCARPAKSQNEMSELYGQAPTLARTDFRKASKAQS
jgi:hypothetical protein